MQVGGGSTVVLALERRAKTYPTCLPPTYRLCLSPSIPTPLICENQFSPNLFFFVVFISPFTSPLKTHPLTPFTVTVRLTYPVLAYSQPLRSLPGGE